MDNATVVGIHSRHGGGFAGFHCFCGQFRCQVGQFGFSRRHIPFHIKENMVAFSALLGDDFVHQILNGVQGLPFFADKDAGLAGLDIDSAGIGAVFDGHVRLDGHGG